MRRTPPSSRRTTAALLTFLVAVGLFIACSEEPTPTPAPTATPTPTAAPTPTASPTATPPPTATPTPTAEPTPTPTPVVNESAFGKDAPLEGAQEMTRLYMEALFATPPDFEAAQVLFAEVCRPSREEFLEQVEGLASLPEGTEFSMQVLGTGTIPGRDDAIMVQSLPRIDGVPIAVPESLMIFENGRWVDADCEAGRKLVFDTHTFDPAEVFAPHSPMLPSPEDGPAEQTEEDIARSFEWVTAEGWRAAFAVEPDLHRIRGQTIGACQTETDQELVELFTQGRGAFAGVETIEIQVLGVERVDEGQAWVNVLFTLDGVPDVPSLSLAVFEDGQWRLGDCLADADPSIQRPTSIEDDPRIAYVGEPVRVQFDYEEQPYDLTVLAPPEQADDTTVRLPVRVTAITDILDFAYVTYFAHLETEADAEGNRTQWWGEPCEPGVTTNLTLVRGGSIEDSICFSADPYAAEEQPIPDEPFVRFTSFEGEESVRVVDLTRSTPAAERRTFEPGSVLAEGAAGVGDEITALACWLFTPYMGLTVLHPGEVLNEATVRVRVRVMSLQSEPLDLAYLFEVAVRLERYGRIHRWTPVMDADGPLATPDNIAGVTLMEGETAEGYIYFEAPPSQPTRLTAPPNALLYWSECWLKPVHL